MRTARRSARPVRAVSRMSEHEQVGSQPHAVHAARVIDEGDGHQPRHEHAHQHRESLEPAGVLVGGRRQGEQRLVPLQGGAEARRRGRDLVAQEQRQDHAGEQRRDDVEPGARAEPQRAAERHADGPHVDRVGEPAIRAARHERLGGKRVHGQAVAVDAQVEHALEHEQAAAQDGGERDDGQVRDGPPDRAIEQRRPGCQDEWKHEHEEEAVGDPAERGRRRGADHHVTCSWMTVAGSALDPT